MSKRKDVSSCVVCGGFLKAKKSRFQGFPIDAYECSKCKEEFFNPIQAERILQRNKRKKEKSLIIADVMEDSYSTECAREAQKILNRRLRRKLPKWRKEGSRNDWIKDIYMIIKWNRSFYYGRINKRDGYKCQDCGIDLVSKNLEYETHHIIPRSCGGGEHPHNLKTLCKPCHRLHTNNLLKNISAYHKNQRRLKKRVIRNE